MAYTRKAATKSPAQYARAKQVETQEVDEVIEEVDEVEDGAEVTDDYAGEDEAEPTPAPAPAPRPAFRRPAPAPAPARQAPAAPAQAQKNENSAVRLTGLFAGKREGCFSGKLRGADMANLSALIEEAQRANQEIVFFLWENQPEQGRPLFSLTANISAPVQKKWNGGGNRGGNFGGQNRGFRRY